MVSRALSGLTPHLVNGPVNKVLRRGQFFALGRLVFVYNAVGKTILIQLHQLLGVSPIGRKGVACILNP